MLPDEVLPDEVLPEVLLTSRFPIFTKREIPPPEKTKYIDEYKYNTYWDLEITNIYLNSRSSDGKFPGLSKREETDDSSADEEDVVLDSEIEASVDWLESLSSRELETITEINKYKLSTDKKDTLDRTLRLQFKELLLSEFIKSNEKNLRFDTFRNPEFGDSSETEYNYFSSYIQQLQYKFNYLINRYNEINKNKILFNDNSVWENSDLEKMKYGRWHPDASPQACADLIIHEKNIDLSDFNQKNPFGEFDDESYLVSYDKDGTFGRLLVDSFEYDSTNEYPYIIIKISIPGHFTIAVLDKIAKQIYYFDPSGQKKIGKAACKNKSDAIINVLCQVFNQRLSELKTIYSFPGNYEFTPINKYNFQDNKHDIFCQTWVFIFIYLRFMLTEDFGEDITKMFSSKDFAVIKTRSSIYHKVPLYIKKICHNDDDTILKNNYYSLILKFRDWLINLKT